MLNAASLNPQISKAESLRRFHDFSEFCDVLNLHLEPALKGKHCEAYHASNTVHTRILDLNPNFDIRTDFNKPKAYYQARNHDGYKLPQYLGRAEEFGFKPCMFVQAQIPSLFVTSKKQQIYVERKRVWNQLYGLYDSKLIAEYDALRQKELLTTNCYNIDDFLHYRFWFFDLDYEYKIPLADLLSGLKELNLLPFVNAIVQTSDTKYHMYIKSEMIATEQQVSNWPSPLKDYELLNATNPEYLEKLSYKQPNKTGLDWFKVAKRGVPSIRRLSSIPIPIPEEAKLRHGLYFGDNKVHADYLECYREIAHVLGSDPCVFDEMRIAQLVGYTNPKSGFTAKLIHINKDALVLTTKLAKTTIHDSIKKFLNNYTYPLYVPRPSQTIEIVEQNLEVNVKPTALPAQILLVNPSEDKIYKRRSSKEIPVDAVEYCRLNNINDLILDKDLNGSSNDMLLLLSRYANKYIDLKDPKQQRTYFDTLIVPYFRERTSKNIRKDKNFKIFFKRFKSLCKHNSKFSSARITKNKQTKYITSSELEKVLEKQLQDLVGNKHACIKSKGHINLRRIICEQAVNHAILKEGDVDEFSFQVPSALLNSVHGYRQKLNFYIGLGLYEIDNTYVKPFRKDGCVIKAGECKKHKLKLNAKEASIPDIIAAEPVKVESSIVVVEAKEIVAANDIKDESTIITLNVPKKRKTKAEEEWDERIEKTRLIEIENQKKQKQLEAKYIPEQWEVKRGLLWMPEIVRSGVISFEGFENCVSDYMDAFHYYQNIIQQEQAADVEDDLRIDQHIAKLNSLHPLTRQEVELLSDDEKTAYAYSVVDLVVILDHGRDWVHRQLDPLPDDPPMMEFIRDFYVKMILNEVVEMKSFTKYDANKLKQLRLFKRSLWFMLRIMDSLILKKREVYAPFREVCADPRYTHSGALVRDCRANPLITPLSPKLHKMYIPATSIQREEDRYVSPIGLAVEQILSYRYQSPYIHRDDYEYLKETLSDNRYILKMLALL